MKRSPLRRNGKSETAKCKVRIQALLRDLALLRDGGCVLFEFGGTGNIPYCGSAPTKDGHIILQYDHLNSRGFNVSFADIRLGVILCQGHHAWKTFRAKKQYDILVRQIIGPERAALWDQVEMDNTPYPMSAWDWVKVEIALKQELEKLTR